MIRGHWTYDPSTNLKNIINSFLGMPPKSRPVKEIQKRILENKQKLKDFFLKNQK